MCNDSMTTRARGRRVRWMIAALLCAGTILTAACSSNGTPTASAVSAGTGSPAGQAKVNCANVDSLRGSLQSLSHTSVSPSSAGTLTKDLTNVQKQLGALKTQGGGRFSGLSRNLNASVNQITNAAGELTTNPAAAVKDLTTALTRLKGKIKPAIAELDKACPKPGT
jgi:phage-related minor tail protein